MDCSQIIGSWQSVCYIDVLGNIQPYDRQTLTFNLNGSGNMHARTLFKRNNAFSWEDEGFNIYIHNMAGRGSVSVARLEDGNLVVAENGMFMVYRKL